ncbi:MAG: HAD family phosphatase [Candidatus Liptonbacteria bacterium]|nr:HAD family phosphatase [Candidatus Liptonbacteria bacterium]
MKKAIIFDMDGVLVDSEPLHVATELQVCRERNIRIPFSEWKTFQGKTDADIFGYIVSKFTDGSVHPKELIEHKRRLFMARAHTIAMVPGAKEFVLLAMLRFELTGLATSSGREYLEKVLGKVHHLTPYFDSIVTRENVTFGKPDPEAYLVSAERLGLAPSECWVVEDSENGIRSAQAAGCSVIGIATSLSLERLIFLNVDFAAENFKDIAVFLGI